MLLGVVLVGRTLEERAKLQASSDMTALQVLMDSSCACKAIGVSLRSSVILKHKCLRMIAHAGSIHGSFIMQPGQLLMIGFLHSSDAMLPSLHCLVSPIDTDKHA